MGSMPASRWISRSTGRRSGSKKVCRRSKTPSRYAPTGLTRRATTKTKAPARRASAAFILSQLMKTALPQTVVASVRSEVVDYVGNESELTAVCTVVVSGHIVGVIKTKFGTNGDEFVRPISDADCVLGILRGKAGPRTHSVIHVLVAHGEECVP